MRKIHRRVRPVETLEQLNKIMTIAAQYTTFSYTKNPYEFKNNCASLRNTTYIQDGQRFLYITTMYPFEGFFKRNFDLFHPFALVCFFHLLEQLGDGFNDDYDDHLFSSFLPAG